MRITCYLGNQEATIEELLDDPIAELLRRSDGLTREQVRDCIAELRRRSRAFLRRPIKNPVRRAPPR
jgi:hypothetical protein